MEACRVLFVTLLVLCGWNLVSGSPKPDHGGGHRGHGDEGCGLLRKLEENYCTLPVLYPAVAVQNCTGNMTQNEWREGVEEIGEIRQRGKRDRGSRNKQRKSGNSQGQKDGMKPRGACFEDCVFRNQSWLSTTDNSVLTSAVTTSLLASVNATWQPILTAALTNCTSILPNITSPTTVHHGKTCATAPSVLMACIKKSLILNCPLTKNGTNYDAQLTKLQAYNPLTAAVHAG